MVFCFGTVCWNGYLEKYIERFVNNYITIYRRLIDSDIDFVNIADPKVVYYNDTPGKATEYFAKKLKDATGKTLQLIFDDNSYTENTVMYSTRNRLRTEFKQSYPIDKKVYFYFPIDDMVRPEIVYELINLEHAEVPTACMFKFYVKQNCNDFTASTRPICSYKDIHPTDWGGYCAYTIFDENKCPLYPEIAIPNIAFYIELYKAGYIQYESKKICIDHLRHEDSHHFKYRDDVMSKKVTEYILKQKQELMKNDL